MEGRNEISHHPALLAVLEGTRPRKFFQNLLGGEILTFDYKWLRGVHREAFTGAHVDNVYMSRGTSELYTMWTPLGDVTTDMGTLAVVESSNNNKNFRKFQVQLTPPPFLVLRCVLSRRPTEAVTLSEKISPALAGSQRTPLRSRRSG